MRLCVTEQNKETKGSVKEVLISASVASEGDDHREANYKEREERVIIGTLEAQWLRGESLQGELGATKGLPGRKDVETNCLPLRHLSLVPAFPEPNESRE